MRWLRLHHPITFRFQYLLVCLGVIGLVIYIALPISADVLGDRQLLMSSSEVSAHTEYKLSFSLPSPSTYGSLVIQACANDPLPGASCSAPGGLDFRGAVLSAQTGPPGFAITAGTTANRVVLSRPPAPASAGAVSYTLQNVSNPSSPGTYYIRLQAYASQDASGSPTYEGGVAFAIINSLTISATVPPYLTFCTGITITGLNCAKAVGDYIDFGELSASKTSSGSSQMLAATNAQDGYNVSLAGTTMTSGANEVPPLSTNDVSRPGIGQFGLNLHANTTPAGGANPSGPGIAQPQPNYSAANSYRFQTGETLVTTAVPDDVRLYTVSYIVNVPKTQPAGIYVSTLTYVCLGTF